MAAIQQIDEMLMLWIQNNLRCTPLNALMIALSYIGNVGKIWIVLSIVLCCFKKTRKAGHCVLITMGICFLFNDILIKYLVCRPRPFNTITQLTVLAEHPSSWSFPSGHTCSSFAAAYVLTRSFPGKGKWAYVLAVLIALSRPYVGAHYVSDILVGAFNGTLGAFFCWKGLSRFYPPQVLKERLTKK